MWIYIWNNNQPRPQQRIPSAYQELEYIDNDGYAFLNTWIQNTRVNKIVLVMSDIYQWPTYADQYSYVVFWTVWNTRWFSSTYYTYNWARFRFHSWDWTKKYYDCNATQTWTKHTLTYTRSTLNVDWVDANYIWTDSSWADPGTYNLLFWSCWNGSQSKYKMYSLQLECVDKTRNYVPCYRKSDEVAWLYCIEDEQFISSSTDHEFLKWPSIWYLPDGYTELEYVANSATTEVVNTWITEWADIKISMVISPLNFDDTERWWIWATWSSNSNLLTNYQSKWRWHNGWNYVDTFTWSVWTMYDIEIDNTWISFNGSKYNCAAWSSYSSDTIKFYKIWTQTWSLMQVYTIAIRKAWVLVRHLIPCKRDIDWLIWFYDLVDWQFFTNSWSWMLIAWPERFSNNNYKQIVDIVRCNTQLPDLWEPNEHTLAYYPLTEDFRDYSGNNHDLTNWTAIISSVNWVACAYSNWWNKYWNDNLWTTTQPFTVSIRWKKNANNNDWASYRWCWNNSNNQSAWMWINNSWVLMIWRRNNDTSTWVAVDTDWHHVVLTFDWTKARVYFDANKVYEWDYSYSISAKPNRLFSNGWDWSLLNWYVRENIYEDVVWSDMQVVRYYNNTCSIFWKQLNTKKIYKSIVWVYTPLSTFSSYHYEPNEDTLGYWKLEDNANSSFAWWVNFQNLWRVQFTHFKWVKCAYFDWVYNSNTDASWLYSSTFWDLQWNQDYTVSMWLAPTRYNNSAEENIMSIGTPGSANQYQLYNLDPISAWTYWYWTASSTNCSLWKRHNIIVTSAAWTFTITYDWVDIASSANTQNLTWYILTLWFSPDNIVNNEIYAWYMWEVIIESWVWDSIKKTAYYNNSKKKFYPEENWKKIWRTDWKPNAHTKAYYPLTSQTTTYDMKTSWTLYNLSNNNVSFWVYQWVDCAQFSPNTSSSYTYLWLYYNWEQVINNSWFTWVCWMYHYWFVRDNPRLCSSYSGNPYWILLKTSTGNIVSWTADENNWYPFDNWAWHLRSVTWSFTPSHFKLYKDWELVKEWSWANTSMSTWLNIWWPDSWSYSRYWSDKYNWLMSEYIVEDIIRSDDNEKDYYNQTKSLYWY